MARAWTFLLVGAAVYAAAVGWAAARLPADGVALHVNVRGAVDRYGSRADALILFAVVGLFLVGTCVLSVVAVRRLPARWINMPYREYWSEPDRLPRFRRMMGFDAVVLFGVLLLLLSYVPVDLTLTTLDPQRHGQAGFLVMIGVLLIAVFGYTAWMYRWRYRPGRDG
jgi:hypothetical protein